MYIRQVCMNDYAFFEQSLKYMHFMEVLYVSETAQQVTVTIFMQVYMWFIYNFMEQSPPRETTSHSGGQEIPRHL